MTRAKKDPESTKAVWWEDLPQDLIDFLDREMEAADERHKRQEDNKAKKMSGKKRAKN